MDLPNVCEVYGIKSFKDTQTFEPSRKEKCILASFYSFFSTAYTHFQNFASFFQNFTHKSKNCTHKMQNASCKMKYCIQNITNTSQTQTFANIFAIILIPEMFVCYIENCVLCFAKKCFMKLKTLVCGSGVGVSGFRNCVTSKDFVCKQLKKTVKKEYVLQE